jgi:hypothetical protein
MTKEETQLILKSLKSTLTASQQLWDEKKESPAYIAGYLEGGIKAVIKHLEESISKKQ